MKRARAQGGSYLYDGASQNTGWFLPEPEHKAVPTCKMERARTQGRDLLNSINTSCGTNQRQVKPRVYAQSPHHSNPPQSPLIPQPPLSSPPPKKKRKKDGPFNLFTTHKRTRNKSCDNYVSADNQQYTFHVYISTLKITCYPLWLVSTYSKIKLPNKATQYNKTSNQCGNLSN